MPSLLLCLHYLTLPGLPQGPSQNKNPTQPRRYLLTPHHAFPLALDEPEFFPLGWTRLVPLLQAATLLYSVVVTSAPLSPSQSPRLRHRALEGTGSGIKSRLRKPTESEQNKAGSSHDK